jgi:hypothetical protein
LAPSSPAFWSDTIWAVADCTPKSVAMMITAILFMVLLPSFLLAAELEFAVSVHPRPLEEHQTCLTMTW